MSYSDVEIRNDGVHRSVGEWTPTVHRLLDALAQSGIPGLPVVLGFDDLGREVVSFVEGEVPLYPAPAWLWHENALTSSARMLRAVHDASVAFAADLPDDAVWRSPSHEPVEVICHNDFAPYNLAYENDECVGVIDFDTASPGPRLWDIAYLAYRMVPLTAPGSSDDVQIVEPLRERRLALLAEAYGIELEPGELERVVVQRLLELAEFTERRAVDENEPDFERHAQQYRGDAEHLAARLAADPV
ncbi:aminoglycoside phosphotransferase family protein [Rathayibacter sp. YIM 133350]|uniref:aminoglycoside phosphotransferase family protein n=1 Tax=Rathayibacter sp. YIM 133350 TaxID=3131992 RepID=UPI00307F6644